MGRARWILAACTLAVAGCSSLEAYSVRTAEESCASLGVCTIYTSDGKQLSPCIQTNDGTIYPGDMNWPYTTPGVCDAVRDGKVISTREDRAQAGGAAAAGAR